MGCATIQIVDKGILHAGRKGTDRATTTWPNFTVVGKDLILALYRVGTTKDCDDEHVEMRRSADGGHSWSEPEKPFPNPLVEGKRGTLKLVYITLVEPGHLVAAAMWVNREAHPGRPLFNPETEGCLPMSVLISHSRDEGRTWSGWKKVPMPDDIGPASLTNPILRYPDGTLALTVETNKHYEDASPWRQRVVHFRSRDEGATWSAPFTVAEDESRRLFYWDQRSCVAPDGKLVTFSWTYERESNSYLNIHRNISADQGRSWRGFDDVGFADQASHPAMLPDGRLVLAWVDRFKTHSIRVAVADKIDAPFRDEVVIYEHRQADQGSKSPGDLLDQMGQWSFGLPYVEAMPDGDVLMGYYAGTDDCIDAYWVRLRISKRPV